MKTFLISIARILLGMLIILVTYALLIFGLFNEFLYLAMLLKWIHILSFCIGFYLAGLVNRKTDYKYLPLLYVTLTVTYLLEILYFPMIAYLIIFPTLALIISRKEIDFTIRKYSKIALAISLIYFMFSQSLVIKLNGFGTTLDKVPVNAFTIGNPYNSKPSLVQNEDFLDINGNVISMDQFKGKNLFITFWATWCGPCIWEQPKLEELKAEFAKNEDIIFVDISIDRDDEKWIAHIGKNKPNGIQLISKNISKTRANYGFDGTPHHVVVNRDGYYRSIIGPTFLKSEYILNSSQIDKYVRVKKEEGN